MRSLGFPIVTAAASTDRDREWPSFRSLTQGSHVVWGHVFPRPAVRFLVEAGTVPAERAASRSWVGIAAADPDRDPRPLDWSRREDDVVDGVVPARIGKRLAGPEAGDDLQALVEHLAARACVAFFAETREACIDADGLAGVAEADAQDHPAVGELIHGRGLAGDIPGTPPSKRSDLRSKSEPVRADGHRRKNGPDVASRRVWVAAVADVVFEKDAVPASCFGPLGEFDEEGGIAALLPGRQ
jgi:hypothetical protein